MQTAHPEHWRFLGVKLLKKVKDVAETRRSNKNADSGKLRQKMGWSPGLVVMGGYSCYEASYTGWTFFAHIIVIKIVMFV